MTVLVLCNVGARDVMLDGKALAPARQEGERLLAGIDQDPGIRQRLGFPIIEPCLRYVAAQHPAEKGRPAGIDRLVLYGTDQKDPEYQATDTLHFAELAALELPRRLAGLVRSAEAARVTGINPSLYDEAFEKYGELLLALAQDEVTACYVILCGGIPACNTAVLLQGVRQYGERLRVVYQPQKGEPQELRAGQQVMHAFREAAAIEHLERLDFANALPRLERLGIDAGTMALVAYASQRLAFDFRSAQASLLRAMEEGDRPTREFIQKHLRHDLDPLVAEDGGQERLLALLRELYWNAAITYLHCRYADFLGRVYRFQEAVFRYLVERTLGLPTDLKPVVRAANLRRWIESIRANSHLESFLDRQHAESRQLDWTEISQPTYKALLSYATGEPPGLDKEGKPLLAPGERKRYAALLHKVNALDRLVELRHRTIIGHDFEGVSEALLLENYTGARTPVEGLEAIVRMLGVDLHADPYRRVAEFVIESVRRQ